VQCQEITRGVSVIYSKDFLKLRENRDQVKVPSSSLDRKRQSIFKL